MKCPEIQNNMSLYYDGEMPENETVVFERHLSACESCRKDYHYFKAAMAALKGLKPIDAPVDLMRSIDDKIDAMERKRSILRDFFSHPLVRLAPQLITVLLVIFVAGAGYYSYNNLVKMSGKDISIFKSANIQTKEEEGTAQRFATLKMEPQKSRAQEIQIKQPLPAADKPQSYGSQDRQLIASLKTPKAEKAPLREDSIEVIPCDENPSVMNERIERLVVLSNGQIIRVNGDKSQNRELLIRVPVNSYGPFMERLKEAMAKGGANGQTGMSRLGAGSLKITGEGGAESDTLSKTVAEEGLAGNLADESAPGPSATATPIPEVRLIKVIYR